ncbi:MAG TPA: T9SS type A sorting domain-containing protein, partial [Cytophagaceae bacterium]|nr:T9SS type A sorting domain-containing protein [Cytophagaceae bacterium]
LATGINNLDFLSGPSADIMLTSAVVVVPVVTSVTASDIGNAGNASDMQVSFTKAYIENYIADYYVMVVPSNHAGAFNVDSAEAVTAGNYIVENKTGSNISIGLSVSATDVFGNPVMQGVSYNVFVLSKAVGAGYSDSLSAPSASVILTVPVPAVTNVLAADVGNAGNASDMQISFTKASDETNISGYEIFVVPSSQAGFFNLTKAITTWTGNYTTIATTGSNPILMLSDTTKDVNGAIIEPGVLYTIFVLSKAANLASSDSLSASSDTIRLASAVVTTVLDAQLILYNISTYENTIYLRNMPSEGKISVVNILGAQVFSGNVMIGDNNYPISTISTGIYIVNLILRNTTVSKQVYLISR